MRLTFASYNIHKAVGTDGRRDADRIIAVLREIDADIIALQEVDRRIGERATVLSRAALDDTPWKPAALARRPRSLGWHGNAILVRRDFEVLEEVAMELPTLEPRGAVRVDVSCLGHRIRILGTHLDLSGLRRRDQIRAILAGAREPDLSTAALWMATVHFLLDCDSAQECEQALAEQLDPLTLRFAPDPNATAILEWRLAANGGPQPHNGDGFYNDEPFVA